MARAMLAKIRQMLCCHQWRITKLQALAPGSSWECTKCGKQHHID